jgi:hypothetical protein
VAWANLSAYRKNEFRLVLGGAASGRRKLFHVEQFAEWECGNLGLLEVDCFVGVAIALNYGVLCIVSVNGDWALFHADWWGEIKESRSSFARERS